MPLRPEVVLARRGGVVELLRLPALLVGAVSAARNRLYDAGWLPSHRLALPVVSVGNLSVGGTGKTPMVVLLARALAERGMSPGVLSRGYRAAEQNDGGAGLNDEGRLFQRLLPDVPQVQDADRVRGAAELSRLGAESIVLDDGFQHRRLARDLDLVLVDATRPWGLPAREPDEAVRALLPRGLLREAPRSLRRADALVITRADALGADELARLDAELEREVPGKPRLLAEHRPVGLRAFDPGDAGDAGGDLGSDGTPAPDDAPAPEGTPAPDGTPEPGGDSRPERELGLEALAGRRVRLVSGIGNPEAFERTARAAGAEVEAVHALPDHHAFTAEELDELRAGGELLVTSKDAVKLAELGVPHLVLDVELVITRGEKVLAALLDALPRSQRTLERDAAHSGLHG